MSSIKNKSNILEIIDKLRSRKSRPDIDRICKFMQKFHKVSSKDTKAALEKCLSERSVYRVEYKGNVSYRNSARSSRRKTLEITKMAQSSSAPNERRVITSAIATLIYQDQSYLENGIAFDDLIKAAASQDSKFSKKQLEMIVHKELSSGSLIRLPNQNLALGPADNNDGDSCDSFKFDYNADSNNTKVTSSANSSCRSSPPRQRGRPRKQVNGNKQTTKLTRNSSSLRVGERRKMAKKVFDPSDHNVTNKKKRGRPVGSLNKSTIQKRLTLSKIVDDCSMDSQQSLNDSEEEADSDGNNEKEKSGGVCSVCMQQSKRNNDRLIECKDCSSKAHIHCLRTGPGLLKLRPDNTWQCPHCKTCVTCCETNDAGVLTVCSVCSDAYHALCHTPRIPERLKAWDQWKCNHCQEPRSRTSSMSVTIPTKTYSKASSNSEPFMKPHELDQTSSKIKQETPIDLKIPDITNWTSCDIYEYFMKHMPEAAPILKEQEMDGLALSMACRKDIVSGLGLPLGPALDLYRIIVRLQTRKDDWTMCWG